MTDDKKKALIALKKAKTSLNKVIDMLSDDKYCIDVLQQTLSVIGLVKSANTSLLTGHINCCVTNALKAKNEKRLKEMTDELAMIIKTSQTK